MLAAKLLATLSGSANQPITVYGISGWANGNHYMSAANGAPDAPATFGLLFTMDSAISALAFAFSCMNVTATQGWSLGYDNVGKAEARMYDGSTADKVLSSAMKAHGATVHALLVTYDGSTLKFWKDRAYIGSIAITSYSTPGATVKAAIGRTSTGNFPASALSILGALTGTAVLSDEQIGQWFDDCASLGDVAPFASGTDYLYSVKQSAQALPATWSAVVGSQDLTKTGTVALNTIANASFAYNTDALLSTRLYNQIRIMPMGDSITAGIGSSDNNGYRAALLTLIDADNDFDVDYIGPAGGGTGDNNHNGYAGSTIQDHDSGGAQDVGLKIGGGTLYHPQIIILLLGANNVGSDGEAAAAPAALQSLVEYIHSREPRTRIVLCHCTTNSSATVRARIATINAGITGTVMPALLAQSIPVVECTETGTALDFSTDLDDATHPNDAGYVKLAAAIYPKVRLVAGWPVS